MRAYEFLSVSVQLCHVGGASWFCTREKPSTGIPVESLFESSFHVFEANIAPWEGRLKPRLHYGRVGSAPRHLLPGKGNSNSHGARPVHLIITMIEWIRTSRLSMKNSLSLPGKWRGDFPGSLFSSSGAGSYPSRPFPTVVTRTVLLPQCRSEFPSQSRSRSSHPSCTTHTYPTLA